MKKYNLMYCHLGNGMTVCNRAVEEHGDYKKIAHISRERNVRFYDEKLPEEIKRQIETVAKTDNSAVSATQSYSKVFSTPPAKFNAGDTVLYTNDYGVFIGKRKISAVTSISYSESGYGYYLEPTDTHWFAVKEENLKLK